MGSEGGRPGMPTQAVRHTCSGNLGIVKTLCYIREIVNKRFVAGRWAPLANGALCLSTPKHNGKSGTGNVKVEKKIIKKLTMHTVIYC